MENEQLSFIMREKEDREFFCHYSKLISLSLFSNLRMSCKFKFYDINLAGMLRTGKPVTKLSKSSH